MSSQKKTWTTSILFIAQLTQLFVMDDWASVANSEVGANFFPQEFRFDDSTLGRLEIFKMLRSGCLLSLPNPYRRHSTPEWYQHWKQKDRFVILNSYDDIPLGLVEDKQNERNVFAYRPFSYRVSLFVS